MVVQRSAACFPWRKVNVMMHLQCLETALRIMREKLKVRTAGLSDVALLMNLGACAVIAGDQPGPQDL